jgi:hypothetical protein
MLAPISMLARTLMLALVALQGATNPSAQAPAKPPIAGGGPGFPGTPVGHTPKVEIAWDRLYDYPDLYANFDRLEAAYPGLIHHEVIGHSVENREMRVYTINNPATGKDTEKPAMWIDGNVHGNEVQGGEATLYLAWYVLENYASNKEVTDLLDRSAFYVLPTVNPDGRAHWFEGAHNAHSSRTGYQPYDDDHDGLFDEDGPDDLDGDGEITQMRKYMPGQGTHRLDPDDPRIMVPVPPNDKGIKGDWILLGEEGIDNDGDGLVNEDPPGGYDMNRAWPSMWEPDYIQDGAGPYPLSWPETSCIARFLLVHPSLAAVQSFHNSGGMILRGPGAEAFGEYPREDLRAFDDIGRDGEKMLPFYRYMVIWKDLYSVFGGFVTWTYEGLGVLSFTNEMWNSDQMYPDKTKVVDPGRNFFGSSSEKDRHFFDDKLLMSSGFVPWHPFDHPQFGKIEIGGWKKDVGRVPPTFMIEEMIHRNALFCLKHAKEMPLVTIEDTVVTDLGDGVKTVDVVFRNAHAISTRTAQASLHKIGMPDVYAIGGNKVDILAGGFRTDQFRPEAIQLAEREPERLVREEGIPGRGEVRVRWFVRGKGSEVTVSFHGQKAKVVSSILKIQ